MKQACENNQHKSTKCTLKKANINHYQILKIPNAARKEMINTKKKKLPKFMKSFATKNLNKPRWLLFTKQNNYGF